MFVKDLADKYYLDENVAVDILLKFLKPIESKKASAAKLTKTLIEAVRKSKASIADLSFLLQQIGFTSPEGLSLMALAESLLRIPDTATIDLLISDKIAGTDWSKFAKSDSVVMKTMGAALNMTGAVSSQGKKGLRGLISKVTGTVADPLIRASVTKSIQLLSSQFVLGETIEKGFKAGKDISCPLFSFDMLGEGARTMEDADRYFASYENAIAEIARAQKKSNPEDSSGISVKISALHPKYYTRKKDLYYDEIFNRLLHLCEQAKSANINLTIDAEEASRLEYSLEIIEGLYLHPNLKDWEGFGFALQAYQKRAFYVLDWLNELLKKGKKRMMVRLVKGAYWDTEIKLAQVGGHVHYPVFTRKENTDLSYIACAVKMLQIDEKLLFPQFATHNANSIATILSIAGKRKIEFQRLHGMGDKLYQEVMKLYKDIKVRTYAPIGEFSDLLPYLVRRLLENGASSSFVNQIYDKDVAISNLNKFVIEQISDDTHYNIKLPLPQQIFPDRPNSGGIEFENSQELAQLLAQMSKAKVTYSGAKGKKFIATESLKLSQNAFAVWSVLSFEDREKCLNNFAKKLEQEMPALCSVLQTEAYKTLDDAISEVREAIDFCYYYRNQARKLWEKNNERLVSPTGEDNRVKYFPKGIVATISPWNFPLAIFLGQIMAAISTGNSVIAKPAKLTPLIAWQVLKIFEDSGFPKHLLQIADISGKEFEQDILKSQQIKAIAFTGSLSTARQIAQALLDSSDELIPLIAETGGQNAMIVDSSALLEQVVDDVIASSFRSAGQRCSALRVLYLQEEIYDKAVKMLIGAMKVLNIGNPQEIWTDVGPVIDKGAKKELDQHVANMRAKGKVLYQYEPNVKLPDLPFVLPTIVEIEDISDLLQENFGPILHLRKFKISKLSEIIDEINNSKFGLTFGIHSRINKRIEEIIHKMRVGNIYVNRNMIGAVVGVNPFGGEGLSGTGFKAGGENYLLRFVNERTMTINLTATGGNIELIQLI